jgi:hypothetical protein
VSTAEGNGQDGRRRPAPLPFGPFQALSSLTEVQRRGMDAAAQVIEGFLSALDGHQPPPPGPADGPGGGPEPGFAQLRTSVARALDLYTDLVRRSFEGYADLVEQSLRARGVRLQGADAGSGELTVQAAAGATAAGTVWLHNTTDEPASAGLRLTVLTAHDGPTVPAAAGRFDPAEARIAPGASLAARLTLDLGGVAPGVYRGHVLAEGLPEAALPLRLVVTAPAPRPP